MSFFYLKVRPDRNKSVRQTKGSTFFIIGYGYIKISSSDGTTCCYLKCDNFFPRKFVSLSKKFQCFVVRLVPKTVSFRKMTV
jgi:hypothetical protein